MNIMLNFLKYYFLVFNNLNVNGFFLIDYYDFINFIVVNNLN